MTTGALMVCAMVALITIAWLACRPQPNNDEFESDWFDDWKL